VKRFIVFTYAIAGLVAVAMLASGARVQAEPPGPSPARVAENTLLALAVAIVPIAAALAGAIGGAIATRFVLKPYEVATTERLTRLQSDLSAESDERKGLRDRLDFQERKRFDILHEQRAQAMRDTYAALCDLEDARDAFQRSFGGFVGGPGPGDYWSKFRDAGERYRNAFHPNQLLFDEGLAADLSQLNRAYVAIVNTYAVLLHTEAAARRSDKDDSAVRRQAEYEALNKLFQSQHYREATGQIVPLQEKVEKAFRAVYGTGA
jgi:hypothetical protein